jgi:hypothetical protein
MNIKGFDLINEEKVERAINGTPGTDGTTIGGISKEDGSYDDNALLAEYDKLGGLIKRGGDTVKTGSFYDIKNRKPFKEPKVIFIYNVNGQNVEVEDGEELPGIVKAARIVAGAKAKTISRKNKKADVEEKSVDVEGDDADVEEKPAKVSRRTNKK